MSENNKPQNSEFTKLTSYSSFDQVPKDFLDNLTKEQLSSFLTILNDSYYNESISMVPDMFYEELEMYYKQKFQTDEITEVCFNRNEKIKLPYPMPSLNKYYPESYKKFNNLVKTFKEILISSKLDGVSCLLVLKKNGVQKLYTKGNGNEGRDISFLLPYLKKQNRLDNLPKNTNIALRGELIIDKKHKSQFPEKALRSHVIGLVIQKPETAKTSPLHLVDIVFYQVLDPAMNAHQQFQYLKSYKLNIPMYNKLPISCISNISLRDQYFYYIENESYEIDGLVISEPSIAYNLTQFDVNNNALIFAYKNNNIFVNTTVTNITWRLSKNKRYVPSIHVEQVNLNGNTISKVTGFNYFKITTMGISIGAIIKLVYSGGVIPNVHSVIKPGIKDDYNLPKGFIYNSNKTEILAVDDNIVSISKQIELYYQFYSIKNITCKTIEKVLEYFKERDINIIDIFTYIDTLSYFFNNCDCSTHILGPVNDQKLQDSLNNFENDPKQITVILACTNKFKDLSYNRLNNILLNSKVIQDIVKHGETIPDDFIDELVKIPQISKILAENFIQGLKYYIKERKTFNIYFKIIYHFISDQNLPKIVFSNLNKKNCDVEKYRHKFIEQNSITKETNYVVTNNINDNNELTTNKALKAKAFNIPVISFESFVQILDSIYKET